MSKPSVGLAVIAACAPGASDSISASSTQTAVDSVVAAITDHHPRSRTLRNEPMWTVESPADSVLCFGVAVAVADLDGDGDPEVIVGESPCSGRVAPGRIAVYPGGRTLPSTTAVRTDLVWPDPLGSGRDMTLSVGDIDGDHRADLLVSTRAGAQVFSGIRNARVPLGAPSFRVSAPGATSRAHAILADVNGDHRDDVVSATERVVTVWLSTPRSPAGPFTASRVLLEAQHPFAAGDVNHDGVNDLITTTFDGGSQLWLGCRGRDPACDGGLRATPAWTTAQPVVGMTGDLNHDGWPEALMSNGSELHFDVLSLHLSDHRSGAPSAAPVWQTLTDSTNGGFFPPVFPGDLDGDHRATDFVVSLDRRTYAFFPREGELATMQPGFAWPAEDKIRDQIASGEVMFDAMVVAAAGDIDHDHFDDLVMGDGSPFLRGRVNHVYLMPGGRRSVHDAPPFLPGAPVCQLPDGGKPDITVDRPALERTLYLSRFAFAADACQIVEGCIGGPGERRLLSFATSLANFGGGPAIVPSFETAPELYHLNECEGEFELDGFARYELLDAAGQTTVMSRKQSIFLFDVAPNCIDASPGPADYFPDSGISPGWGDVYAPFTSCQWLDTTDLPDGRYTLRVSVDVNHLIDQDDVRPDTVSLNIELAGDTVRVLP